MVSSRVASIAYADGSANKTMNSVCCVELSFLARKRVHDPFGTERRVTEACECGVVSSRMEDKNASDVCMP